MHVATIEEMRQAIKKISRVDPQDTSSSKDSSKHPIILQQNNPSTKIKDKNRS